MSEKPHKAIRFESCFEPYQLFPGGGTILGFLGPNGAGKSTTMNIITGYISPTEGSITVDGFDTLENPLEAKSASAICRKSPSIYGHDRQRVPELYV